MQFLNPSTPGFAQQVLEVCVWKVIFLPFETSVASWPWIQGHWEILKAFSPTHCVEIQLPLPLLWLNAFFPLCVCVGVCMGVGGQCCALNSGAGVELHSYTIDSLFRAETLFSCAQLYSVGSAVFLHLEWGFTNLVQLINYWLWSGNEQFSQKESIHNSSLTTNVVKHPTCVCHTVQVSLCEILNNSTQFELMLNSYLCVSFTCELQK